MLRTGQRSSLGPFLAIERDETDGGEREEVSRCRTMWCVGVESSEIGRVSAQRHSGLIPFRRGMIALAAVRKGSRIRPLSIREMLYRESI